MMTEALARTGMRGLLERPAAYTIAAPIFTIAGAATTVLAPRLLNPEEFGRFVLLVSIFQYVAECDFGLSRLTDRALALPPGQRLHCSVAELLWTRMWIAGAIWLAAIVISRLIDRSWGSLVFIAASGGVAFMLSNGPVAIYRARGRIGEFTATALLMQFGMSVPRLLGLLVAGVKGCFIALAAWYVLTAAIFTTRTSAEAGSPPSLARVLRLILTGLPLFVFGTSWSLYLLANRWIASLLVTPEETGLFGFGVTLVTVGVGVIGTIAQVHYPKHLARGATAPLARELGGLLAIATSGIVFAVWGCRALIPSLFPAFTAAAPAAAALLVAGLPLAMCSWLIPLAVATTARPWREASVIFGASVAVLAAAMALGREAGGITLMAWCCLPSSVLLLSILLQRLVSAGLLNAATSRWLMFGAVLGLSAGGVEWLVLFH